MNEKQLSKGKIALILAGVMASLLLAALDSTVVSTAMKNIVESMGGMQYFSWPFTIYMLCSTISILVCGGLADIYGHKPVFLVGISGFLAGSLLCGMAQNMIQLIIFRGIQGIGAGLIVSGVFTVVADLFEPGERGKYMGIVTSMYGLASIIGPLAGGLITDTLGWRWIFLVNIPLGLIAFALVAIAMPAFHSGEQKMKVDYPGICLFILALTPLLLDFSLAGKAFDWVSVPSIGILLFSCVMFFVFVAAEKRSSNPMLPLTFFRDRAISIVFLISFLSQAVMFSAVMYLPYFIQGVIGSSATTSGAVITPMMLGLLLASNIMGQIVSRIGKVKLLTSASFVVMAAGAYLLSTMAVDTTYFSAIVYMVILGFGVGMSMPITFINAQSAAPKRQIGSVTSTVMFFRNTGGTIGSAVFGFIMANSMSNGFSRLNVERLPQDLQGVLKNTQIITNAQTVAAIQAKVPQTYLTFFNTAYLQAKAVLTDSIHDVFLFCTVIAVLGIILALLLRESYVPRLKKAAPETEEAARQASEE